MRRRATLFLGAALLLLSLNTDFLVPAAAWVYGVFLLRYTRQNPGWRALCDVGLVQLVGSFVWLCATATIASGSVSLTFVALAVFLTTPYAVDRWLGGGLLGTLAFPLARAAAEYLFTVTTGFGNFGSLAETQADHPALLQLAALTGSYGVSFLVAWPSSALNTAWERAWTSWRPVLPVTITLALVVLAGEVRARPSTTTIRVAGLTPRRGVADRNEDLLERSDREAAAGARIIVWSEDAGRGPEEALLPRIAAVARRRGVFIAAAYGPPPRNRVSLIGPEGTLRWRYDKAHPTPFELRAGQVPGDGVIPVNSDQPRLAPLICYDLDFPSLVRRASADLLLVPAHDWPGFGELHARKAVIRAIESGLPIVRPAAGGVSMAIDSRGHFVAATVGPTLIAEVPVGRRRTPYAAIGDVFAWLTLAALTIASLRQRTQLAQGGRSPGHQTDH